jgi:hypothetical protein
MSSRSLIALLFAFLNVQCSLGEPVVHAPTPLAASADAGSPILLSEPSQDEEPAYYVPELVCRGLRKPIQYDGQWVLGIDSKKFNEFHPWLFFDNEMNARSCSVYFPGLQIRRRKAGCCWIKG